MRECDIVIVGGGIVGLATAYQLTRRHPDASIIVLEKEARVGQHQTGHNSGVLHSGIYYKPGSLKATNCRHGKELMQNFCDEHDIPYDLCGKVIVAVDDEQVPQLESIYQRGQQNGVTCEMIDVDTLRDIEPHVRGVKAIHVPETGIVDYGRVCEVLASVINAGNGAVICSARVDQIHVEGDRAAVRSANGETYRAKMLVTCGGLHSDRLARRGGGTREVRIVPFRGEYYELNSDAKHLCRNLIYPTPDPAFPFLGVHFTRMIDGSVECGPNAVLALAREGYTWRDIKPRDLAETLTYPAFWKIAMKYWRTGAGEIWRSISKAAFVKALQRLVPEIRAEHLHRAPAGVRAQALASDGTLLDDFAIDARPGVVNVLNAPSPAATASLAIGETIADHVDGQRQ